MKPLQEQVQGFVNELNSPALDMEKQPPLGQPLPGKYIRVICSLSRLIFILLFVRMLYLRLWTHAHKHTHAHARSLVHILPWPKKITIPEICGEKNTVRSCDIMLDHERSAQGKGSTTIRNFYPALIARDRA